VRADAALLVFLGTGPRQPVTYVLDEDRVRAAHPALALAQVLRPRRARLLGTRKACEELGAEVRRGLEVLGVVVEVIAWPDGPADKDVWARYHTLGTSLERLEEAELWLDVTGVGPELGLALSSGLGRWTASGLVDPDVPFRVFCGSGTDDSTEVQLRDLGALVDLPAWTAAVAAVERSGRTHDLHLLLRRKIRAESRRGNEAGAARMGACAVALLSFADDFAAVRTGALLGPLGSACRLAEALTAAAADLCGSFPSLAPSLDELVARLSPLGWTEPAYGARALANLALYYLDADRYTDAALICREAYLTRYADEDARFPPGVRTPGSSAVVLGSFSTLRQAAEAQAAADPRFCRLEQLRQAMIRAGFDADGSPARRLMSDLQREVLALISDGVG
jgi:hypothetical protein